MLASLAGIIVVGLAEIRLRRLPTGPIAIGMAVQTVMVLSHKTIGNAHDQEVAPTRRPSMPSETVELKNETGLHARPARVFAKAAGDYDGEVKISKDGKSVNAKSTLSVLTLDCHQGDQITIHVEGDGADEALGELVALVEDGLGE